MSLTVRVQPVVITRDWRQTLDWLSRVFELPITRASEGSQVGELLISGSHVDVLGREGPGEGADTVALAVEVFDLEAALERATANGGSVLADPAEAPGGGGRQASIKLPTGTVILLREVDEEIEQGAALGNGTLHFSVRRRIQAPAEKVFEAMTRASELSRYFVKEAKGDLVTGADITWSWDSDVVGLEVTRVVANRTVEFLWEAYGVGYLTRVRFDVIALPTETRVTIVESGWQNDARGRQSAFDHAEGWTEFLLHLRLWLEKGIDIR